ncbi:MAG TPA: hypothetical protein H9725_07535, partial [Candidatus Faecalibacterium gallistercoris]|nr:hypothetical protein [Candidatus Faecalibacterium gallistercoris]
TLQGGPISACCAGQKFLPPGIPLGTKFGAEPRTRPCGLAHSQRQISLYVSRPSAHVGWTGLFWQGFCFGILWDKQDGKKDLQDVLFKKYKNLSEKLAK